WQRGPGFSWHSPFGDRLRLDPVRLDGKRGQDPLGKTRETPTRPPGKGSRAGIFLSAFFRAADAAGNGGPGKGFFCGTLSWCSLSIRAKTQNRPVLSYSSSV